MANGETCKTNRHRGARPNPNVCRSVWKRVLADRRRGFVRSEDGATAVEFALLALPFFMLIFAILETAIVFIAQLTMQHAVDIVAREVRTGQVAAVNMSETDFRKMLCDKAMFFDCSKIKIDLRGYGQFADISTTVPITTKNGKKVLDDGHFEYHAGQTAEIMALRVFYAWPLYLDFIQRSLSELGDGSYLIVATAGFQTEPF